MTNANENTGPSGRRWGNRILLAALAVAVFGAGFFTGHQGQASTPAPGSYEDPLVSQSYMEQYVALMVVELAAGQTLEGSGGTEVIVRSGQACAVGNSQGGICDVTAGKDLANGARITTNHLLIVPRTDGRGIRAETKLWVMVRGPYSIK